jgi:hypothetical protein
MLPFVALTTESDMSDRIEWITIITAPTGLLIGLILIYLALATSAVAQGRCSPPEPVKWHQQTGLGSCDLRPGASSLTGLFLGWLPEKKGARQRRHPGASWGYAMVSPHERSEVIMQTDCAQVMANMFRFCRSCWDAWRRGRPGGL